MDFKEDAFSFSPGIYNGHLSPQLAQSFLAIVGVQFKLFAKLKEFADVRCRMDGFVARHHQDQFKAPAGVGVPANTYNSIVIKMR